MDRVRSRQRENASGDVDERLPVNESRSPEEDLLAGERSGELNALLSQLPPDQKEVLLLRFAAGLDTHETGAVMRKKANAVRQLQFRALDNIRQMIAEGAGATWQ